MNDHDPNRATAPTGRTSRRPGRTVAATALAAVAAVSLAGCQWTSTVQTDRPYIPADGAQANVGQVQLRNVLVVADRQGGEGNVYGLAVNSSTTPVDVSVSGAEGNASFQVPPQGSMQFSTEQAKMTLPQVQGAPGSLVPLRVQTSAGAVEVQAPVLAPEGYYQTLAPTGQGTAPTDIPSGGSSEGQSGGPSESPTSTEDPAAAPAAETTAPSGGH